MFRIFTNYMVWRVLFIISLLLIVYTMAGYPILLAFLDRVVKKAAVPDNADIDVPVTPSDALPTVTYMITAHNEEKVIEEKLRNTLQIDYPADKFEIVVASDGSTDRTDGITARFAEAFPEKKIRLYRAEEHKGKTHTQNLCQKTANGEILVMTDANSEVAPDAVKKLAACFSDPSVAYVCGRLSYTNAERSNTAGSESAYWNYELYMRGVESKLDSVTAGNGALYACRNRLYHDFSPSNSHDAAMPPYYRKHGYRALFCSDAAAYEKAGEKNAEEFKRKVRMNRNILKTVMAGLPFLNVFKYGLYGLFYTSHRTLRYLLWFNHLLLLVGTTGMIFSLGADRWLGAVFTAGQIAVFLLALLQIKTSFRCKLLRWPGYYGLTVLSQVAAVINDIRQTDNTVWEKAESTR